MSILFHYKQVPKSYGAVSDNKMGDVELSGIVPLAIKTTNSF